jgi:hypothetical protein
MRPICIARELADLELLPRPPKVLRERDDAFTDEPLSIDSVELGEISHDESRPKRASGTHA